MDKTPSTDDDDAPKPPIVDCTVRVGDNDDRLGDMARCAW